MNRRKYSAILAALATVLAFTACGKKSESAEGTALMSEATVQTTAVTTVPTMETYEVPYDPQVEDWEDETTNPTETQPKETQPKETQPKETQPKETQPKETQPKETQPKETQPKETQPKETQPKETQPKETQPKETQPKETQPKETEPKETKPKDPLALEYQAYLNMTPTQQQEKYEQMGAAAFMEWYQRAKIAYEASQDYVEISGGEIDLGQLGNS